jgi:hypothetical protein
VLRQLPPVDVTINRFGWGICAAVAGLSDAAGQPCARDYSLTVRHAPGRGYSTVEALAQRVAYARSLGPDLSGRMLRIYRSFQALREPRPADRQVAHG